MPVQADEQADHDAHAAGNGGHCQGGPAAVDKEAEQDGHDNEQQGDHGHGRVGGRGGGVQHAVHIGGLEGAGHDGGESGHHQHQGQVGKDQEQLLGTVADVQGDHLADGLALVADGSEQGTVVMDGAEKDAADQHPQHHRHPAEYGGLDGAVDGAGAGDRRKVVAHQHRSLGGDIVHAVLQLMGRGGPGVIHAPLLGKPSAVEDVTYDQNDNANGKN